MYHVCGEPCITYESNQGLCDYGRGIVLNYNEIYAHHMIFLRNCVSLLSKNINFKNVIFVFS